jgi:hypothetical protein
MVMGERVVDHDSGVVKSSEKKSNSLNAPKVMGFLSWAVSGGLYCGSVRGSTIGGLGAACIFIGGFKHGLLFMIPIGIALWIGGYYMYRGEALAGC